MSRFGWGEMVVVDIKKKTNLLTVFAIIKTIWQNCYHYNIIQFYRRINSVGDSNEIRRWKQYRRIHRRKSSIGITVVGKAHFRR